MASVSGPKLRESKPDLAFEAPTCENRDTSFSSTRQGGYNYLAAAGLCLMFFALTVKVLREWIIIKITTKFHNFVKSALSFIILHETLNVRDYSGWVYCTGSGMSFKPALPPV
jgi:hypothetical protein